jgi:hypothetical protein
MSDTPKFEVIDRRKMKAEEEKENQQQPAATTPEPAPAPAPPAPSAPPAPPASGGGPRLVVSEPKPKAAAEAEAELPPAPTAQESREQKTAYDASAQRLEDIVRAQNPAAGAQPPISFENLVQQFYVSAMIQMGAGAQEGQRPRIDILGARTTIDLLGEKTRGNLTEAEDKTLQTVLFEVRMAFMELTSMITLQSMQPPPPPPDKN